MPKQQHKLIIGEASGEVVKKTLLGQEYLVVPVIAMIEGVRFGANAGGNGELGLAEEFGKFPAAWNNRPVVFNHPRVENNFVSAGASPEVLEEVYLGTIQNTKLSGKKLKMEAWLDVNQAESGKFDDIFDRLDDEEVIEVSVGFFTEVEEVTGEFRGQEYDAIWRNIVPDHLAFLEEGTIGACSVEDGCGTPRMNNLFVLNNGGNMPLRTKPTAQAESKVQKDSCGCNSEPCGCTTNEAVLLSPQIDYKGFKQNDDDMVIVPQREAQVIQHLVSQLVPDNTLDLDVRQALSKAVREVYEYAYVIGFTNEHCLYEVYMSEKNGWVTVQQAFSMNADGAVEFTTDPEEVQLMTRVVPVANLADGEESDNVNVNHEEDAMPKSKLNDQETTEGANSPAATGSQTPETTDNEVTGQNSAEDNTAAEDTVESSDSEVEAQSATTVQEYITNAPEGIRDTLQTMHRSHEKRKAEIIQSIKDTGRCGFDDTYLKSQSLQALEQLQKLADVPDYSGRGTPISRAQEADSEGVVTAPKVFEMKKPSSEAA